MPITFQDEQLNKLGTYIAKYFVESLYGESISPSKFVEGFDSNTKIFKGVIYSAAEKLWEERNATQDDKEDIRDFTTPCLLVRSAEESSPEEKLATFLPEEKILFNKKIVRNILSEVSFINITLEAERVILERLKHETIGLSDQEIFLYYNLVKLAAVGTVPSSGGDVKAQLDSDKVLQDTVVALDLNIAMFDSCKAINDNKAVEKSLVKEILGMKVMKRRASPQVLKMVSGGYSENQFFVSIIKNFLKVITTKWGASESEALSYMVMYFVMAGNDEEYINSLNLSRVLKTMALGKPARLKATVSVAIIFLHHFTTMLASQTFEISKKFQTSNSEQQDKIIKLYAAAERRQLITNNAANFAFQKISDFKAEQSEIINTYKVFQQKFKTVLSVKEMFQIHY